MKKWKSKTFGDTRLNFYGWIFTGLFLLFLSLWFVAHAIWLDADRSPACLLLIAIYVLLLGHFGLALQEYCARVAKSLEQDEAVNRDPGLKD